MLAEAAIYVLVTDLLFDICRHACDEWEEMLTVNVFPLSLPPPPHPSPLPLPTATPLST